MKVHAGTDSSDPQPADQARASALAERARLPEGQALATIRGRPTPRSLLGLQRMAGNAAVGQMIARSRSVTVSRDVPPAPAAPAILNGSTPLDRAADGFKQGVPDALNQAWGILNSQAMFALLPLLLGMKARGHWSAISAGAAGRGGPRMQIAVHAVNLKTKGTPITKDELRDLIDRLATVKPDQRADILRFIGKYVVITVDGLDLDISYVAGAASASAAGEVRATIKENRFFINEYAATLRDRRVKTGADVENAVGASLASQGMGIAVAGSTSSTGAITITPQPMSKAQPILIRSTEIHEAVHSHTVALLARRFGSGTAAFDRAFNDAKKWVADEINARRAENRFLRRVLFALRRLERMVK